MMRRRQQQQLMGSDHQQPLSGGGGHRSAVLSQSFASSSSSTAASPRLQVQRRILLPTTAHWFRRLFLVLVWITTLGRCMVLWMDHHNHNEHDVVIPTSSPGMVGPNPSTTTTTTTTTTLVRTPSRGMPASSQTTMTFGKTLSEAETTTTSRKTTRTVVSQPQPHRHGMTDALTTDAPNQASSSVSSFDQDAIFRTTVHSPPTNTNHNKCPPSSSSSRGILYISHGDVEGAAGTIFYLFILNQLLYADRHGLQPWIHLNDISHWIYDPMVHGDQQQQTRGSLTVRLPRGRILDQGGNHSSPTSACPPPPTYPTTDDDDEWETIPIHGTGVWSSYFEPVSDFDPRTWSSTSTGKNDTTASTHAAASSCAPPPPPVVFQLSMRHILQGLHLHCPDSVRAWRYGGLVSSSSNNNRTLRQWLGRNRQQGAALVQKYYRPLPYLWQAAARALQTPLLVGSGGGIDPLHHPAPEDSLFAGSGPTTTTTTTVSRALHFPSPTTGDARAGTTPRSSVTCLAMHVRHSDKANHRKRLKLVQFLPYVQVYLQSMPSSAFVFVATDSSLVVDRIQQTWPRDIVNRIRLQPHVVRSPNRTAVFQLVDHTVQNGTHHHHKTHHGGGHHRTNVEVLVDSLAMSHCQFLLHGLSAVSESSIFWNLDLHNHSVNLEDPQYMRVAEFAKLVQQQYQ